MLMDTNLSSSAHSVYRTNSISILLHGKNDLPRVLIAIILDAMNHTIAFEVSDFLAYVALV